VPAQQKQREVRRFRGVGWHVICSCSIDMQRWECWLWQRHSHTGCRRNGDSDLRCCSEDGGWGLGRRKEQHEKKKPKEKEKYTPVVVAL